jgi:hypothetical protein
MARLLYCLSIATMVSVSCHSSFATLPDPVQEDVFLAPMTSSEAGSDALEVAALRDHAIRFSKGFWPYFAAKYNLSFLNLFAAAIVLDNSVYRKKIDTSFAYAVLNDSTRSAMLKFLPSDPGGDEKISIDSSARSMSDKEDPHKLDSVLGDFNNRKNALLARHPLTADISHDYATFYKIMSQPAGTTPYVLVFSHATYLQLWAVLQSLNFSGQVQMKP